jgi:hypothetical protein
MKENEFFESLYNRADKVKYIQTQYDLISQCRKKCYQEQLVKEN